MLQVCLTVTFTFLPATTEGHVTGRVGRVTVRMRRTMENTTVSIQGRTVSEKKCAV